LRRSPFARPAGASGAAVHAVKLQDLVTVPPWAWRQFRATPDRPLGFLCLVDATRDRPQLPTQEELAALRADAEVARFLDGGGGEQG
jgi:hypothetical protein